MHSHLIILLMRLPLNPLQLRQGEIPLPYALLALRTIFFYNSYHISTFLFNAYHGH